MTTPTTLEQRKALLIARSDLERVRLRTDLEEMGDLFAPFVLPARARQAARIGAGLLSLVMAAVGARRVARVLRIVTLLLVVYRAVRSWRGAA